MANKRKVMSKRRDKAVFEVTANRTHKKNLDTKYAKGGIRF